MLKRPLPLIGAFAWGFVLLLALLALYASTFNTAYAWPPAPGRTPGPAFVKPGGTGLLCEQNSPCGSIQYIVEQCEPGNGDTIYVASGTYTGTGSAVITVTKSITIYGGWDGQPTGPVVRDTNAYVTTLDGEYARRVVHASGGTTMMLDGLQIVRGNASGLNRQGGGLYGNNLPSLYLIDCVFSNNVAYSATLASSEADGGGIYLLNPYETVVISSCQFLSNTAAHAPNTTGYGGGLYVGGGVVYPNTQVSVIDSTFRGNVASIAQSGGGGGLYLAQNRTFLIQNNDIEGNVAGGSGGTGLGGGLYLWYPYGNQVAITGNRLAENFANDGGGEGYGGAMFLTNADNASVNDNIVQGNTGSAGGTGGGAGLRANQSTLTVRSNRILSNTASLNPSATGLGGGLWLDSSTAQIINNFIARNRADTFGAGVWAGGASGGPVSMDLRHNTIADNLGDGASIGDYVTAYLTNTIASGNTSAFESRGSVQCVLNADHTLFWNNTSGISGTNYFDGNPDFIDPPTGNYHIGPTSAAINQGIDAGVTDDIDGNPRPVGSAPDIGADERPGYLVYSPSVTKQYP